MRPNKHLLNIFLSILFAITLVACTKQTAKNGLQISQENNNFTSTIDENSELLHDPYQFEFISASVDDLDELVTYTVYPSDWRKTEIVDVYHSNDFWFVKWEDGIIATLNDYYYELDIPSKENTNNSIFYDVYSCGPVNRIDEHLFTDIDSVLDNIESLKKAPFVRGQEQAKTANGNIITVYYNDLQNTAETVHITMNDNFTRTAKHTLNQNVNLVNQILNAVNLDKDELYLKQDVLYIQGINDELLQSALDQIVPENHCATLYLYTKEKRYFQEAAHISFLFNQDGSDLETVFWNESTDVYSSKKIIPYNPLDKQ